MRIKAICLNWFRGAAAAATLETNSKSAVVYGPNGSGKSSFVDAVEYVLEGGRIGHLSHEYSGCKQEKGVLNTHKPSTEKCKFTVTFSDDSELLVFVNRDGTASFSGAKHTLMPEWDYKRTVLRQDEVAAFIGARKGDKYSALLPLLNLQSLEIAAENLRQLARTIEQRPSVKERRQQIYQVQSEKMTRFGNQSDDQIWAFIRGIHKKYLLNDAFGNANPIVCAALDRELADRISRFSEDQRCHWLLLDVKGHDVGGKIGQTRIASSTSPRMRNR